MAKYHLTELGYVAADYTQRHITTFRRLCDEITEATGFEVKEPSFQYARRNDRAYDKLREVCLDYMRSKDPLLVETALANYDAQYRQRGVS